MLEDIVGMSHPRFLAFRLARPLLSRRVYPSTFPRSGSGLIFGSDVVDGIIHHLVTRTLQLTSGGGTQTTSGKHILRNTSSSIQSLLSQVASPTFKEWCGVTE